MHGWFAPQGAVRIGTRAKAAFLEGRLLCAAGLARDAKNWVLAFSYFLGVDKAGFSGKGFDADGRVVRLDLPRM